MVAKRGVLVLCVVVLLLGCAGYANKINNLNVGMTKADVIEVMGEPDYTSGSGTVEILSYKLKTGCCFTDTFFVKIKDGKVERYGQQGSFGTYY
jgi:hypothetical protein